MASLVMKGFSRIWILGLGIAVAIIIAAAMVKGATADTSFTGNQPGPKAKLVPSTLLKKAIEKIEPAFSTRKGN